MLLPVGSEGDPRDPSILGAGQVHEEAPGDEKIEQLGWVALIWVVSWLQAVG